MYMQQDFYRSNDWQASGQLWFQGVDCGPKRWLVLIFAVIRQKVAGRMSQFERLAQELRAMR